MASNDSGKGWGYTLVLLLLFPLVGWGEALAGSYPDLSQAMEEFTRIVVGKSLRHRQVLLWLKALSPNEEAGERFYLFFLARVRAGTGSEELATLTLRSLRMEPTGDFAEAEILTCSRFFLFHRCAPLEVEWRKAEEKVWVLVPPQTLLLEE